MKDYKNKSTAPVDVTTKDTPGEQEGKYEQPTPENVRQEVKELNNIGPHGKEY